jgi:parvulin-like peptidyl-prolyl isomerase
MIRRLLISFASARRASAMALAILSALGISCSTFAVAAATVNGDKITESEVERQLGVLRSDPVFGEALRTDPDERGNGRRTILTRLIYSAVAEQQARRFGITPTRGQIERLLEQRAQQEGLSVSEFLEAQNLTQAEGHSIAEQLVREFALQDRVLRGIRLDDDEVRAQYEQNEQAFAEAHLERITVKTEQDARDVLEQLNGGEDFDALASELSIDDSAQDGGDLGYVALARLAPEAQNAVSAAVVGGVTDPVQTASGFEVIHVIDRRIKPFEEAEEEIRSSLAESQRQERYAQWLAERVRKAKIVVNPKYGVFDREQAQVVAETSELQP